MIIFGFAVFMVLFVLIGVASGLVSKKPTQIMLISTMIVGLFSMLIWRFMGYGEIIYEAGIGIPCAIIYYLIHKFYLKIFFKKNV
ncbi:MAG: hypothetical protein ACKO47_04495 [Alphaproteobacteria bacterium]